MTMMKFKSVFTVMFVMLFASLVYAGPKYPSELAKVVKKYPNGEVHMTAKKGNEVNAAILAKGVTERKTVFDFYRKALDGNGWKVELEMENPMMSVMNFSKDGMLLIVGLMDHKQPGNQGIMITLTLESNKEIPKKETTGPEKQNERETDKKGDYQDNKDGTVTQPSTNLVWQQADDSNKRSWHEAVSYCTDLSLGGSADWRLPEKNELMGLKISPEFVTKPGFYWTNTDKTPGSILSWAVKFSKSGGDSKEQNKARKFHVRCVRDGS